MSALDDNSAAESRPTGIGPGERLQAARIQRGLSLEDVAKRMHLSVSILESIEDNNFEEITAPIFVKGYLRAYARIVALDEDDMIQQYSDFYSEEDPPITSTSNMAHELAITDARIKTTTYVVILVLLALLAAWWWNKEQNTGTPISLDAQAPEIVDDTDAQNAVAVPQIEAVSESLIESTDAAVSSTDLATDDSPAIEMPVEAQTSALVEIAPTAPNESLETVSETESEIKTETQSEDNSVNASQVSGAEAAPATTRSPSLLAPSGTDKLKIIVHADTWADIKDSSDYQLVYDLLRADQSIELIGAAPFNVFLGNGHGVEIYFNEAQVDVSTRVRDDNTARLKIQN